MLDEWHSVLHHDELANVINRLERLFRIVEGPVEAGQPLIIVPLPFMKSLYEIFLRVILRIDDGRVIPRDPQICKALLE